MPENNFKKACGLDVRRIRTEQRVSQKDLAARAGLHPNHVSDVGRGTRTLSVDNIGKLGRALKLSVRALFCHANGQEFSTRHVEILLVENGRLDVELPLHAFRTVRIRGGVNVARDGAEALGFLFVTGAHERRRNQPSPGVILLDLNLPKVSGLRRIKADARMLRPVISLCRSAIRISARPRRRTWPKTFLRGCGIRVRSPEPSGGFA